MREAPTAPLLALQDGSTPKPYQATGQDASGRVFAQTRTKGGMLKKPRRITRQKNRDSHQSRHEKSLKEPPLSGLSRQGGKAFPCRMPR